MLDLDAAAQLISEPPKALERLVRAGYVQRHAGQFNPVQLVRGYVDHIRAEARRPTERPTQLEIAAHLDLSERSVRDLLGGLGIDHRQATLDQMRVAYIRDLREKAAGRGLSSQDELNRAKIREANANADLKELEAITRAGKLVPVADIETLLAAWATAARSEIEAQFEQLVAEIASRYGIDIDGTLIDDRFVATCRAIADYPRLNGWTGDEDQSPLSAAAEAGDDRLAE